MARMKQIAIDVDVNRVIETSRLSLSESANDILRRLLIDRQPAADQLTILAVTQMDVPQYGERSRGQWQVKFANEVVSATNLKDAYLNLLRLAAAHHARFLDTFSTYKARTRRYVARDGEALYLHSKHLAKQFAVEFVPGWYADSNLSEEQVGKRIRSAAFAVGLIYGSDVWIKDGGRTI